MSEKIYTFPSIEPQKPMTEEEFDKLLANNGGY